MPFCVAERLYRLLHTAGWAREDQRPKRRALRILLRPLSKTRLSLMARVYRVLEELQSMLLGTHIHINYFRLPQQPYEETGQSLFYPGSLSATLRWYLEQ